MKIRKKEFKSRQKYYNTICYLLLSFHSGISDISSLAVQYFLKDELKTEPGTLGQVTSITLIPFMIKPLFGLITDIYPLFGYRRKYYIIFSGIVDILSWVAMATFVTTFRWVVLVQFVMNCALSFSTVLGEAIVVELSKIKTDILEEEGKSAKETVSMFFLFKNIGILASSFLKGYLVDVMSLKGIFLISAVTPVLIILSGIVIVEKNTVEDRKEKLARESVLKSIIVDKTSMQAKNEQIQVQVEIPEEKIPLKEEIEQVGGHSQDEDLKIKSGTSSESGELSISYQSAWNKFSSFALQKAVIVPILFIIFFMGTPSYDDPLFYFITNELKFSGNIIGQISFVSSLMAVLSILLYKFVFINVGFKKMMVACTFALFGFSFIGFILTNRWNKQIGVSDYITLLFANVSYSMIGEIVSMPILSLACILSPKSIEATVYSLYMSAVNFGGILSNLSGSFLTSYFHVTSHDFHNLPNLILTSSLLGFVPLLILPCIDDSYFHPEKQKENGSVLE